MTFPGGRGHAGAVVSRLRSFDLGDPERRLERWLLETNHSLDPRIRAQLLKEFDTIYRDPDCGTESRPPGDLGGRPRYEPALWNGDVDILLANNCYNYSTDHRFPNGDAATPGAGGGQPVVLGDCAISRQPCCRTTTRS